MNHKDLWNRITSNGMREMTEDRFYQALKEIDLPESKEIDNNGDWLSPIQSEREHQEKQLKELWPDYPNGCPKWQTLNGLLFYTNKFMELDEKFDGWIPVSERLPEPERNFIHPSNWFIRVLVCHTFGWREYFIEDHVKENLHQFMLEDAKSRLNGFTHWSIPALPAPQGEKEKEARTCKNCAQREGEECGINGREVYDDSTCNDWCEKD